MIDDELRRVRIVCENLAARVGQLTAENIELLVRLHELEHPEPAPSANGQTVKAAVS